jgi:hypothetical protein
MMVRRGSKPFCKRCVMDSPDGQPGPDHGANRRGSLTLRNEQGLVIRGSSTPDVLAIVVAAERPMRPSVKGGRGSRHDIVMGHPAVSLVINGRPAGISQQEGFQRRVRSLEGRKDAESWHERSLSARTGLRCLTVDVLDLRLGVPGVSEVRPGQATRTQAGKSP